MKILAAQRLQANMPVSEFLEAVEKSFRSKFPKSNISVVAKTGFRIPGSIYITLTLGKGREDYPNGYKENDAMHQTFWIHGVLNEEGTEFNGKPLKVEGNAVLMLPSSKPHLAYDKVKVWRNFTAKDPQALIRRMDSYFGKLKELVKKNIEGVSEVHKKDMSSYV